MSDESNTPGTFELIIIELTQMVEPAVVAVKRADEGEYDSFYTLIHDIGIDGDQAVPIGDELLDIALDFSEVWDALSLVSSGSTGERTLSPEDVRATLSALRSLSDAVDSVNEISFSGVTAVDSRGLGDRIVDHLLVRYLYTSHPPLHVVLRLLGIITEGYDEGPGSIDFDRVGDLLSGPTQATQSDWGTPRFDGLLLLTHLSNLVERAGVMSTIERGDPKEYLALLRLSPPLDIENLEHQLRIPLVSYVDRTASSPRRIDAGIKILVLPGNDTHWPGLALVPYGTLSGGEEVSLSEDLVFTIGFTTESLSWGINIHPRQGDEVDVSLESLDPESEGPATAHVDAAFVYSPTIEADEETVVLGSPDSSRVGIQHMSAAATIDYDGTEATFSIGFPVAGHIVVSPEGGFLQDVIPEDIEIQFDETVGWSSADGLYFGSGGRLVVAVPLHVDLGFGTINELYLALDGTTDGSDFALQVATSVAIELGPLSGSVDRIGLRANVSIPEDEDGNLGPVDLAIGFRPPDGIGLAIDAGPVSGGGFLGFYPEENRYTGAFELTVSDYVIKVVGLLTTELPGRDDGFSLLLIITGELPPIQLGFGFTLNGLGGLIGIHRAFETKPLGEAVRTGSLDSVLFPEDPIGNMNQIVTDLRSIFPPRLDVHVFGPMARFGWGTPMMLRMDLGVLISIPTWKIALLGNILLQLPDEEAPLVDLKLAVAGVLDIPGKEVSIDASLYDSRVAAYTVSGDMALRSGWGDDPRFVVAVGGFHPKYTPPTGFPELGRVAVSVSEGDNPRIELSGYFAVTSNTFQVGAGLLLHADAGPALVHGELSFDALFQFDPFQFVVDFFSKLRFEVFGEGFTIKLEGKLSGPGPYRVTGSVTIEFLFWDVDIDVDVRIGSTPTVTVLPDADVLSKVAAALAQPANYTAHEPAGDASFVTLWDPTKDESGETDGATPGGERLLAHPLGTLGVRQKVVPLEFPIEKFGNARPTHSEFSITEFYVSHPAGGPETGDLKAEPGLNRKPIMENFAPAQFREMSDTEKLQAPAFEREKAGASLRNGAVRYAGQDDPTLVKAADLSYETSVVDREKNVYRLQEADLALVVNQPRWDSGLSVTIADELANASAVATGATRTTGAAKYRVERDGLSVTDQRYVVVWRETLERVSVDGESVSPASGQTYTAASSRRDRFVDTHPEHDGAVCVVGLQEATEGGPT